MYTVQCQRNTATLLDEPLVPVPFILKLCAVWQYFFCFCIQFCIMTDPIKHLNKVSGRRFFLITLSHREEGGEEEGEICTI